MTASERMRRARAIARDIAESEAYTAAVNEYYTVDFSALEAGSIYEVSWQARDIGYGVESGCDEYLYKGVEHGKHAFEPESGETVYLFEDEVLHVEALSC